MRNIDLLNLSLGNLLANRLRTILTICGVSIGIGAILFLVSLGFGLQNLTINQIVKSSALTTIDVTNPNSSILKLDSDTIDKIRLIPHVETVSAYTSLSAQISFNNTVTDCAVNGVDESYLDFVGLRTNPIKAELKSSGGSGLPPVIISTGALKLFGITKPENVLGNEIDLNIFINTDKEEKSEELTQIQKKFRLAAFFEDSASIAYIPVSEIKKAGIDKYTGVKVKVDEIGNNSAVRETIANLGFSTKSVSDMIDQVQKIFKIIEWVLGGFGIIALFVASIGMFNTMTIALLERTRDIGVMKAIGARKGDILKMFLTESILIGVIGGITGILLAIGLGKIINFGVNILAERAGGQAVSLFYTPWNFVIFILIFSFAVGVLTGIYPAKRASNLNPLDALRYE